MTIRRWSKIFTLGDQYTDGIFDGPVSITEKVDGSQINFGVHPENGLTILSKGSVVHLGDSNGLFAPAAAHIEKLHQAGKLKEGWTYHGETLAKPRHNTLAYDNIPKNHIALYGVSREDGSQITTNNSTSPGHEGLQVIADNLEIDVVPEFYRGTVTPESAMSKINEWLEQESYLGGQKIEGVVIKNYTKQQWLGGQLLPLMQAKFVSEAFKEKHKVSWPQNNKSPLFVIGETVRTEARWLKAVQHKREDGTLEGTPRDIGDLLKRLHEDLEGEDKEWIKEKLWKEFSKDIKRAAVRGFPEWYKEYLVKERFGDE